MEAQEHLDTFESLDLQHVLTRYVDSHKGYIQAAELMERPALAAAFLEIAERRREIGLKVARLIRREGEQPDAEGSTEGSLHRWWIRFREKLSDEEFKAVLAECIRGEKTLAAALHTAIDSNDVKPGQATILQEALAEVTVAIEHFETAIES